MTIDDRDKIELLQLALHTKFDARSRMTKILNDDYAGAVATYKDVAAEDRALELRSARLLAINIDEMPVEVLVRWNVTMACCGGHTTSSSRKLAMPLLS